MQQDLPAPPVAFPVFEDESNKLMYTLLALGGGVCLSVCFVLTFLARVVSSNDNPMGIVPGIFTTMGALFSFSYAFTMLVRPWKVLLEVDGLLLVSRMGRHKILFVDIAFIEMKKKSAAFPVYTQSAGESLLLLNAKRKELAALASTFTNLQILRGIIADRAAAHRIEPPAFAPPASIKAKQLRRARIALVACGCFLSFIGIGTSWWGFTEYLADRRFEREAVDHKAVVLNHFLRGNSPRIEYALFDDLAPFREAIIERAAWDDMFKGGYIDVKYLPSDPSISRAAGERLPDRNQQYLFMIGGPIEVLMGVALLIAAAFGATEVKIEKGRIRILRAPATQIEPPAPEPLPAALPAALPAPLAVAPEIADFKQKVPGGVTALAVINIAFGLGIFGFNAILFAVTVVNIAGALEYVPAWDFVRAALMACSTILGLLWIAAGFGLYLIKNWARLLTITLAIIKLLFGLVNMYYGLFVVTLMATPGVEEARQTALLVGGGWCGFSVLSMIYPGVVLFMLFTPAMRQMFRRRV